MLAAARPGRARLCCCTTVAGTGRPPWRPCRASSMGCAAWASLPPSCPADPSRRLGCDLLPGVRPIQCPCKRETQQTEATMTTGCWARTRPVDRAGCRRRDADVAVDAASLAAEGHCAASLKIGRQVRYRKASSNDGRPEASRPDPPTRAAREELSTMTDGGHDLVSDLNHPATLAAGLAA
jgi:hypothetical protein